MLALISPVVFGVILALGYQGMSLPGLATVIIKLTVISAVISGLLGFMISHKVRWGVIILGTIAGLYLVYLGLLYTPWVINIDFLNN
jgi:hypothetical protein